MANPAHACEYFSSFFTGIKLSPQTEAITIPIIVAIVTAAKTTETITTPATLFFAAGYIKIGIKGSHGPKTKIKNNVQAQVLD